MKKTNSQSPTRKTSQESNDMLLDLQRTRADFENFRKNVDLRIAAAHADGRAEMIKQLLPIIDDIERATANLPADLAGNDWAQGVLSLNKKLEATLVAIGVQKINAVPGTVFDPSYHDAVQFDDSATGDMEVIESEMQPGYLFAGEPIRHAMVRVTRK